MPPDADDVCPHRLDTSRMFWTTGVIFTRPVRCEYQRGHSGLHCNTEYGWPYQWSDSWAQNDRSPDA